MNLSTWVENDKEEVATENSLTFLTASNPYQNAENYRNGLLRKKLLNEVNES